MLSFKYTDMEYTKFLVICRFVSDCSDWTETAVSVTRYNVSQYTAVRLYVKFVPVTP